MTVLLAEQWMGSSVTVQGQLLLMGQVCGLVVGWLQAFSVQRRSAFAWNDFALFVIPVLRSLLLVSWRGIGGNLSRIIKDLYLIWETTAAYFASQTRRVCWEAIVWMMEEGESWWKVVWKIELKRKKVDEKFYWPSGNVSTVGVSFKKNHFG